VISIEQHQHTMEDDRAQVDLGIAVDVEDRLEEAAAQRQPKKRFVGRRTAEAASSSGSISNVLHNGAVEGKQEFAALPFSFTDISKSPSQEGYLEH